VRSPFLGEHTDEILKSVVGLSDEDIAAARAAGAI
jgi:crotonobetainyl-CoA:carnitine CoA-transferase CaiB-like acyl-CoA transferase